MNKKICHLTSSHSINDDRIFLKECITLAANGFDVTLIACSDTSFEDMKNGVKRISMSIPVKNKLQRMIKRSKAVYTKALEIDADVYHFHDIELFRYGLKLKRIGKKVIFDSHEDWPMYLIEVKWVPKIIRRLAVCFLENSYMKYLNKFDATVTVTPHIVKKLKQYSKKVHLITNYPLVDVNNLSLFSQEEYSQRNNVLLYSGTVYSVSNQEIILDAIYKIQNINYYIAGKLNDDYKNKLLKYPSWNKVNFLGFLTTENLKKVYQKATIGIVLPDYNGNSGFKQGSLGSNKLFDYMKFGLPVICTDFEIWKERIINKYKCGICVNPKNINEVQKAIQYLINNKEIAYQMGQNAQKAVIEEFNWMSQEATLLGVYNNSI